ncbi:MAG TPA: hypothetical protein VEU30_09640 [Thermoanaerobaculia bacterium]|nr:hypothetical protein [Thermoanaerobaculia bacterium]
MAIGIVTNLKPVPRKTPVPGTITLKQTMISDQTAEQVIAEFRLAGGHDIWFELPSGTPSKSITFQHEVSSENTDVTYEVTLIRNVGTALDGSIGIDQTVTDEGGIQLPDHCTVVIT